MYSDTRGEPRDTTIGSSTVFGTISRIFLSRKEIRGVSEAGIGPRSVGSILLPPKVEILNLTDKNADEKEKMGIIGRRGLYPSTRSDASSCSKMERLKSLSKRDRCNSNGPYNSKFPRPTGGRALHTCRPERTRVSSS